MNGRDIFKIYAPYGAKWIDWIRPVPFVAIDIYNRKPISNWKDRKVMFINEYDKNTAIFIDLPGIESIELGVALARIGYRPIPVFNGTDEQQGARATTDTYLIESCLINGGEKLKTIFLNNNANPAFLLDSYRINRYRSNESIFDNSWDVYKQDVPSAKYFIKNDITKIIVVTDKIQKDLKKILINYQNEGILIYETDSYTFPQKITLSKSLIERFEKEEL